MNENDYSTTDPFLMAWFRFSGQGIKDLQREGSRSRMSFDLTEAEGLTLELKYRDSEFERFAQLHSSTMDLLKRR